MQPVNESVKPPVWHLPLCVAVVAGSALTAVLAAVRIVLLQRDATALTQGLYPATVLRPTEVEYAVVGTAGAALLWATYASVIVWLVLIRRRLRPGFDRAWFRRLPAYVIWRISAVLFIVTTVFSGVFAPPPRSVDSLAEWAAYDHRLQWVAAIRIAIGTVCVWFAVSVLRAAPVRESG